ncbi:MAG: AAA family ATPase [Pseudomonadales bacterium]
MRLLRMSLSNWRGVASREIEFAPGVTLIEGPNEIGKSTFIEALQLLFSTLDSAKNKKVKAIKPVGQDVGSSVEVELTVGTHHLIYGKTFNRATQTSLRILAPKPGQHTGREAHQQVEALLAEHVDMALWQALLVDQSDNTTLANLQQSTGLAQALDEAAGRAADDHAAPQNHDSKEEHSLFEAIKAEFELYFTVKTNKPKDSYAHQHRAVEQARTAQDAASAALDQVQDNLELERQQRREVARLTEALPTLQRTFEAQEAAWQAVLTLQKQQAVGHKEWQAANTIAQDAARAWQQRNDLQETIRTSSESEQQARASIKPLLQRTSNLQTAITAATTRVGELKQTVARARQTLELATADAEYLHNVEQLAQQEARQQQSLRIAAERTEQLKISSTILVDAAALKVLQQLDRDIDVARRALDTAATSISLTPVTELKISANDEALTITPEQPLQRTVASQLHIELPGVALIKATPSSSVSDLAEQAATAEAQLRSQLGKLQASNLADAIAQHERRNDALVQAKALQAEQQQILQGTSAEELTQHTVALRQRCERYLETRQADTPPAKDTIAATANVASARSRLASAEQQIEGSRDEESRARSEFAEQDKTLRSAEQHLAGLEAALADRRATLANAQSERSDETLQTLAEQSATRAAALATKMAQLDADLAAATPEATQSLRDNAESVLHRAKQDSIDAAQQLAVQTDRLQQSRANGIHETWERAKRDVQEAEAALTATQQRANAARKLWQVINQHRSAAREAYVAPLKDALERLGQIVFGGSFSVAINDDWSIESRTLHGTTLAFDELSIGAKEQLAIMMRLAATQIVAKQGGVPLVIDDALGFSDPGRLATMGAAIAAAGKTCQIILLSCAPGRFTHVGNAKVIRLQDQ